jgi:hypothetical protein
VNEHWPRDLAPVFYPHLPNPFWIEAPGTEEVPPGEEIIPAPTITGITPNGGDKNGGVGVTITGTGFVGVTSVMFGSVPATGVIPDTPAQFTCLSPKTSKSTMDVSVTAAGGTATLPQAYTANGPTQFQVQSVQEQSSSPSDSDLSDVAQRIQEGAETIGQAAQDIGEAAQSLTEPSGPSGATSTTPEAPSGSAVTTEASAGTEDDSPTEWELDQYWGIEAERPSEAEPEP